MNDIPLLNLVPSKYQHWIVAAGLIAPYIGRVYHALVNGGGIMGAWRAIMFGTNAPKDALTSSESANLRVTTIKDVPAELPVPKPTAPLSVQDANQKP